MITQLDPTHYENVRSLFNGLWYHLNLFAVIEGKYAGQVYADHAVNPTAALVWDQVEGNWYLAGDCANPKIVQGFHALVSDALLPAGSAMPDMVEYVVNWHPEAWEEHFEIILAGTAPLRHLRKHFLIDVAPAVDWRAALPDGYEMRLVDDDLLAQDDLVNIDRLRGWGSGSHDAMKPLMGGGIGCCILDGNHIVSWCMGDCAAGNAVEVGIHTDEAYRRRGLATLATAAMVENCLASGADYVGWHCWSSNEASARTALKVGFWQTIEHPVYHAWYNRVDNQFVRGNMLKFEYDDPEDAINAYALGFQMIEDDHPDVNSSRFVPNWLGQMHYNMACALATCGDLPAAFDHLHQAVDRGWQDATQLQNEPALASLRSMPEWTILIARIDGS